MHSAAVHGRDTGWLPAGWGYKILVMASQNIHSLVVAYRLPSIVHFNVSIFQGSAVGGLFCSSAERVSNARSRPAGDYLHGLVAGFFAYLRHSSRRCYLKVGHQRNPWVVGEEATRQI